MILLAPWQVSSEACPSGSRSDCFSSAWLTERASDVFLLSLCLSERLSFGAYGTEWAL